MSYVSKTLGDGEKVIYRAQFNWTYSFAAWLWLLAGVIPATIGIVIHIRNPSTVFHVVTPLGVVSIIAFALGAAIFLQRIAHIITTEIVVTNIRLIMKTGWISRNSHEISISNIEEVSFRQSLLGRVLGYGQITVRGTGVGEIKLPPLGHPLEIQHHLDDARAALRRDKVEQAV